MALLGLPCLSHMSVEHVIDRQAKSLPSERALRSGRSADRVANGVPCGLASCDPCRTGRLMLVSTFFETGPIAGAYVSLLGPAVVFFSTPLTTVHSPDTTSAPLCLVPPSGL